MTRQMSEVGECEDTRLASAKEVTRSRGLPLGPAVRAFFEKQFNRNFDFVRVHCDERASRSARLLNASAYTVGSHIVFAEGRYDPETRAGRWLLAHELSHVVQQTQGSELFLMNTITPGELESAADRAADLVLGGCTIPRDFRFGTAPAGIPQFHIDPAWPANPQHQPCGGIASTLGPAEGQIAHRILERHYATTDGQESAQENAIFYGSDWGNNPQVPAGAPNQAFARALLDRLLQLPIADRPNIIDFHLRDAYFFVRWVSPASATAAIRVINRFHAIVNGLEQRFNEGNWDSENSFWFPNHVLEISFPPGPLFVCTQATDHDPPRGLIMYDIRNRSRRRRQQRPSEIRMLDFWRLYGQFRQMVRSNLPTTIPVFDPDSPDYVIIVPDEFIRNPKVKKMMEANMQPEWDKFRVDAWMSRNRLTLDPGAKNFYLGLVIIVGAVAIVVVTGGMAAPEAVPAASVVAIEVAPPASMIVPIAETSAPIAVGMGKVLMFKAAASAPVVQGLMKAAGVVLVIGFVDVAQAGNTSATLKNAVAIRTVPINDFTEKGGQLYADSSPVVPDNMYTTQQFKEKFSIGTKVFFDNEQHWVLGQVQVR